MTMTVSPKKPKVAEREAWLTLVPMSVAWRLACGGVFGLCWMLGTVRPLVLAIESDFPRGMLMAMMFVAMVAPAVLFVRRHVLPASVRWDDLGVTLLEGGRVATSIAWRDAKWSERREGGWSKAHVVQIRDDRGRRITLVSGARWGSDWVEGRRQMQVGALEALAAVARASAAEHENRITRERATPPAIVAMIAALSMLALGSVHGTGGLLAVLVAIACVTLLWAPATRVVSALARPAGRELLMIDHEDRGRLHARRLDGSRVLLDVAPAAHPDALLSLRRGFLSAVLEIPSDTVGVPYRTDETPIAATFVETRDDRVLRFEHLRAALVDVIGYGTFFATAVAAALIS